MQAYRAQAEKIVARCRHLAAHTEEPGFITRTFLSEPMRAVHVDVRQWMEKAGMRVHIDAAGNIRGLYSGTLPDAPRIVIGSHLDTVPRAGAFDGILGVMLGIALVEALQQRRLPYEIEIVGFSEEEGVRFDVPFIGSRALTGELNATVLDRRDANGVSVAAAIRAYGLDLASLPDAAANARASMYLEFHIEQGPVLESLSLPLGIVTAIAGQSRLEVCFHGHANHAGTTPMHLRRDALAGAAEWIAAVEREANATPGLVATVGKIVAHPGASNVIADDVKMSLDVRHTDNGARTNAVSRLMNCAQHIAARRFLTLTYETKLDQAAVAMDPDLVERLAHAVRESGHADHRMPSGAGHDAMIMAKRMPVAMLFLRSPGGISHHPDEAVLPEDVAAALATGMKFLEQWVPHG